MFDGVLKGFGLRITAAGTRTFLFQYNVPGGKRRKVIGTFGTEMTTAQARRRAEGLRGQVRDGRDPVGEEVAKAAAAVAAAAAAAFTLDVLIRQWAEHHLAQRSASYRHRVPRELRAAMADWLSRPARELGRVDAVSVLDAVKTGSGPVAANRLRAEARACWGWAIKRGALAENPWSETPRPLARETARERVLSDTELGVLYVTAGRMAEPWGVLVRLLLLTGQRRGEVAGMQWDEVDLEAAIWRLPGDRTKNRHPHTVPLPREAVDLLRSVKRRTGATFVFEGPRKTAASGFGKVKQRLDIALARAVDGGRSVAPWVLHDIRRTVATGLQRLGVRLEVIEAVLNHVSGSRAGIVGVYERHGWEEEKSAALKAWAKHVLQLAEEKDGEDNAAVPDLRREAGRRA
jgi:integrase